MRTRWQMEKEIRQAEIEQRELLKGKEVTLQVDKINNEFRYGLFYNNMLYFLTRDKHQMWNYLYFLGVKVTSIKHINYNLLENDIAF